jgi:hypothetical protein
MDKAVLGQVSSEYFRFPCHSFIPLIAPHSSPPIIQGWYNRPINGCSKVGSVPLQPNKETNKGVQLFKHKCEKSNKLDNGTA